MKILGIRNSPKAIRFCILEGTKENYEFKNANDENKILLPKSLKSDRERCDWLSGEFIRIFDHFGPFEHVALKQNENVPARYSSLKPVMFMDCILSMCAYQKGIDVSSLVYASIGTKNKEVQSFAESRVEKSSLTWDTQMADAIAAGIKVIEDEI